MPHKIAVTRIATNMTDVAQLGSAMGAAALNCLAKPKDAGSSPAVRPPFSINSLNSCDTVPSSVRIAHGTRAS